MRDNRYVIRAGNAPTEIVINGGVVTNVGPATIYYAASVAVTVEICDGSLAVGDEVALQGVQRFITDGPRATLSVA